MTDGKKVITLIWCRDCVHGQQMYCCEGCDTPGTIPMAFCAHYQRHKDGLGLIK